MNDQDRSPEHDETQDEEHATGKINLTLIYGVMLLALLVAIGFAVLIVLPFYHRR